MLPSWRQLPGQQKWWLSLRPGVNVPLIPAVKIPIAWRCCPPVWLGTRPGLAWGPSLLGVPPCVSQPPRWWCRTLLGGTGAGSCEPSCGPGPRPASGHGRSPTVLLWAGCGCLALCQEWLAAGCREHLPGGPFNPVEVVLRGDVDARPLRLAADGHPQAGNANHPVALGPCFPAHERGTNVGLCVGRTKDGGRWSAGGQMGIQGKGSPKEQPATFGEGQRHPNPAAGSPA